MQQGERDIYRRKGGSGLQRASERSTILRRAGRLSVWVANWRGFGSGVGIKQAATDVAGALRTPEYTSHRCLPDLASARWKKAHHNRAAHANPGQKSPATWKWPVSTWLPPTHGQRSRRLTACDRSDLLTLSLIEAVICSPATSGRDAELSGRVASGAWRVQMTATRRGMRPIGSKPGPILGWLGVGVPASLGVGAQSRSIAPDIDQTS